MPIPESFEQAAAHFTEHLARSGCPSRLCWVCREDLTGHRCRLFAHPQPPATNRELYRRHYERGVALGRSVALQALGFAASQAYCSVWVSPDAFCTDHPERTGDLHLHTFCFHETGAPMPATRCRTSLGFRLRRVWCRWLGESPGVQDIPARRRPQSVNVTTHAA